MSRAVSGPAALLLMLLALAAPLAAQVPPDAVWHAFDTPHFRVTFSKGLEEVAREAASRAEAAHAVLSREVASPPRGRIELVIADNVDYTNGYATPLPTNRIVVYAHPPVDSPELAFTADWLHMVVLHELVHIFHLDDASGVWDRLRRVFGRNALLFPQVFVPSWLVEGLATFYESRLTPGGRVRGTLFDMALRAAVLEDAFFSVDRASGDPTRWPGGSSRYIYGALFVDFLARRHGVERVPEFLARNGRQLLPYRVDAVARRSFGESFSRAWSIWEDSLRTHYAAVAAEVRAAGVTEPEILTEEGRVAAFPRFSPDGRVLAYSAATGLDRPATRLILADGSVETVGERTTIGPVSWQRDGGGLLLSQLEYVDPYRIYSDLYRARPDGGLSRLTRAARLLDPDPHPDGAKAVAVQGGEGTTALVLVDLASGAVTPLGGSEPDVQWALPRWSPRGDRIAASRWARGGLFDVVVLDAAGAVVREITRDQAVDGAPAWSPDGRYVIFSSDRTGIPNLFAYDLQADRLLQVTNVLTGAMQPDVSPDGRWIAFAYYRSDGYHIARIPFDPGSWRPASEPRHPERPLEAGRSFAPAGGEARRYSPWRSLAPAGWTLLGDWGTALGPGVGAAVAGVDVVERHAWSADALVYPEDARFEGAAAYRYRGLGNPVLDLSIGQGWQVWQTASDDTSSAVLRREREAAASLLWTRRRWRSTTWIRPGAELSRPSFHWEDPERAQARELRRFPVDAAATLELGFSSARGTALSLGPQRGFTASGVLEGHRYTAPLRGETEPRGYVRATGRGRGYQALALPGFARHVLGVRVDAGMESGSISPGFSAGGASGGSLPIAVDLPVLGGGLRFPIRGFPQGVQRGNRVLSATAEYRFPLLLAERGYRLVPAFVDRLWGDLFVDAGTAWCSAKCGARFGDAATDPRPLYSIGAEAVVELRVGYLVETPLRFGVALPLNGEAGARPVVHLRVGRSF